ncbi:Interacts with outer membrane receptor proteins that carry out high-affinity binding and energy dependent uptake into the periplasmic space of specific substrates. It could act to transduce energy from the cytoplasmic membrane to specific energy- requiring processes in the outer membrane [Vibrio sp. B1ASS3]|nr:Interacts with outer membrane receptor proteins that carry out high-affinity binding and energy dependent uptake into the periplasmic space of specific substrates. It could act to transduce energy from the cytoplasmic membrane to specific energy- requiring processes in the outer membrane [Vibrio sp. B1ASS3]CAE6962338.1 Interacts with outer membrane receptor proteins that carry out high-affinity binding and energy dependent uptake into the periplasmic space of specific substrates. It could act t
MVHAALLFVSQETKVFAMPAGNPTSSVSLNLVSAPKPVQAEPTPQEVVEEKLPEPQKKPQPKPEPKPVKKTVEKPIVKKEAIKKKPVEKKPKPVKKPQTSKPVAKKDPQPKEKVEKKVAKEPVPRQKAAPTEQSKGATSQPVMIDQPAFVSQPVQPRYPRSARKRGIEGVALYEVWLDENGNQVKQVLIESSGAEMLDVSALRAIKQWQFSPHISGGQKVAHRVQIPVRFKLDG